VVLSVFGPRNPAEIRRVLAPGGALIVATPGAGHLREPREALGLIGIDERKGARLAEAFGDYAIAAVTPVRYQLRLGHADLTNLVAMGPNARHIGADALADRVAALPSPFTVTVDVEVRGLSTKELSACRRTMCCYPAPVPDLLPGVRVEALARLRHPGSPAGLVLAEGACRRLASPIGRNNDVK
jgi:hypothetical protein